MDEEVHTATSALTRSSRNGRELSYRRDPTSLAAYAERRDLKAKLRAEKLAKAYALHADGLPNNVIGARLGVDSSCVGNWLKAAGLKSNPRGEP